MIRTFNAWAQNHQVAQMFIGFVVFTISAVAFTSALGDGVPWFGLATAACVWALITLYVWCRARRAAGQA